jgi:hypothetical protein
MIAFALRVVAATLVLFVVQGLAAGIAFAALGRAPDLPPGSMGWILLSNLLTAATMACLAVRSRLWGIRLAAWLALTLFVTYTFNGMVEAVFFHVFGMTDFARNQLLGGLTAIAFSPVLVAILGRWRRAATGPGASVFPSASLSSRAWRLVAADLLYLVCYFGAGTLIYSFVREYYENRGLPPRLLVAALQFFLRGPIYIALALLAVRVLDGERWERGVLVGAMLSILGGVAPLLIPNPYLPDGVRWAHLFEVGISNLVYGWAVAWLLTPPPRSVGELAGSRA